MFSVRMADARLWRSLIGAISTLVDEAGFDVDSEGIRLRAMDPSHVAMVDFEWPKAVFDEYLCDEPTKLCINISEMLKLLRRIGADEVINLDLEEKGWLKMTLEGRYTRVFRIATLEASSEEVPTPKISFKSVVKTTTTCLRNAVEDASTISDHIVFETAEDRFRMEATGDLGSVTIDVDRESQEILAFDVKEASRAMYSLSYLSEMVKAAYNISEIVTIGFSTDMPLRLSFELPQGGRLQYYLAPRIESSY